MQSNSNNHRIQDNRLNKYPALASLRITTDDLEDLAHQGFVCEESRGGRSYSKLRFRSGGKQVVRYIGGSDRAAIVKDELAILQAEAKIMRDLKAKVKFANKMLRKAKSLMEPVLKANGLIFHGYAIRRPRRRRNAISTFPKS